MAKRHTNQSQIDSLFYYLKACDVIHDPSQSKAVEAHVEAFEARVEEQNTSLKLMVEKLAKTIITALTQC
jgi:hypothetical protein